ncbi:activating signal cointegrator 1 complex subunit 2-like protein, partial [Leptotrombidium deliense]
SNGALNRVETNGQHCRKNAENRTNEVVVSVNEKNSNCVEGEDQTTIDRATLESYITNITDIFPDIGHGFIEVCLEHYNNDVERVVDALLSGSLPESIDKLDRNMTRKPISSNVQKATTNIVKCREISPIIDNSSAEQFPQFTELIDVDCKIQRTDVKESLEASNNLKRNYSQRSSSTECYARMSTTKSEFKENFTIKSSNWRQNYADSNTENLIDKEKVPNNVASTSYMSHVKKPLPHIDEKTKEIIKLAAIRIENEYEDEYDDTYEIVDPKIVDSDVKLTTENEERRRNPKAEKFFTKRV